MPLIDPLLFATVRLATFIGTQGLTNASGFFFRRDDKLFLVTSRHVFIDEAQEHHPDRVEIELHLDADNAAQSTGWSVPLFANKLAAWRQGLDDAGEIDVAAIEIERGKLPAGVVLQAFTPQHLAAEADQVIIGRPLVITGFPTHCQVTCCAGNCSACIHRAWTWAIVIAMSTNRSASMFLGMPTF